MATEITQTDVATAALQPAEMSADGVTVKQRPIDELLDAKHEGDTKTASTKAHRGIRFTKLIPGGTD